MGPPSLPGHAPRRSLFTTPSMTRASESSAGNPVVDFEADESDEIAAVYVDRNGQRMPYTPISSCWRRAVSSGRVSTPRARASRNRSSAVTFRSRRPVRLVESSGVRRPAFAAFGVVPDDELRRPTRRATYSSTTSGPRAASSAARTSRRRNREAASRSRPASWRDANASEQLDLTSHERRRTIDEMRPNSADRCLRERGHGPSTGRGQLLQVHDVRTSCPVAEVDDEFPGPKFQGRSSGD